MNRGSDEIADEPTTHGRERRSAARVAALTLSALGVVYGDIGTSPLYALQGVFDGAHHPVPIARKTCSASCR